MKIVKACCGSCAYHRPCGLPIDCGWFDDNGRDLNYCCDRYIIDEELEKEIPFEEMLEALEDVYEMLDLNKWEPGILKSIPVIIQKARESLK